jgi:FKBP-type peptidyl-prolyl cis-trans isomerase FkpA
MYKFICLLLTCLFIQQISAVEKDSTVTFSLPDSLKAISFMAEINIQSINSSKEQFAGIKTDLVKLSLETEEKKKSVVFEFPATASVSSKGLQVDDSEKGELEWDYNWSLNEHYKLLIIIAQDSANHYSLHTGYFWLPKEHKWKLIGTCKIKGQWRSIQHPGIYFTNLKKKPLQIITEQAWCQRNNGKWKNLLSTEEKPPVINLQSHIDSLSQFELEKRIIEQAISIGKSDARDNVEGVYYKIIKEGTGTQIALNNTVSVSYKGYLFSDESVFDETKDKPISFPLNRLVKGWQLGLPLCKVGGKIKLIIPSALAYSIRTITSTIPPNSILVFEIEVLDSN